MVVVRWVSYLRLAAAAGVVATGGCGPDLPSDVEWRSKTFRYHTRQQETVACQGMLETFERHFAVMTAYLGIKWPEGRRIDYFKFVDEHDFDRQMPLCKGHGGCFASGAIYSINAFDPHELIHAYLAPIGRPGPLIEEGAAMALGCGSDPPVRTNLDWATAVRFERGPRETELYAAAAWLVADLIRKHGTATFLRLYRQLPNTNDPAIVAEHFQRVYGQSIERAWAEAMAAEDPRSGCLSVWECSGEPLLSDGSPARTEHGCGLDRDHRRFEVSRGGTVEWTWDGGSEFLLGSCSDRASAPLRGFRGPGRSLVPLVAGDYFIEHRGTAARISAQLTSPAPMGSSCADAATAMDLADDHLSIAVPDGHGPWYFRLRSHLPRNALLSQATHAQQLSVELCPVCDDAEPSVCTAAEPGRPIVVDREQVLVIGARPTMSQDGFTILQIVPEAPRVVH